MTKSAIAKKILQLHRKGEALNIAAVRRNHPELLDAAYCFQPFLGWKQAIELAGLSYESIKIELEESVECQVCGKHLRILTRHVLDKHDFSDIAEYRQSFPNAEIVCEQTRARATKIASSVPAWEPILSMEYILDRVWFWKTTHGQCNSKFISLQDRSILGYIVVRSIKWDDIVRRVGFDPAKERFTAKHEPRNADELIAILQERHRLGLNLTSATLHREHPGAVKSMQKIFGGLTNALIASGIPFASAQYGAKFRMEETYPDEQSVIAIFHQRAKDGLPIIRQEIKATDPLLSYAILQYFGSFGKFLAKVSPYHRHFKNQKVVFTESKNGLRISSTKYPTVDSVLKALRHRHRNGLGLKQTDVAQDDPPLKSAAYRLCGSWISAIKMAGLEKVYQKSRDAVVRKDAIYNSAEMTVKALKALAENGHSLTQDDAAKNDRPLKNAAYRHFGSWPDAIKAAKLTSLWLQQKEYNNIHRSTATYPTAESVIEALQRRAARGASLTSEKVKKEEPKIRTAVYAKIGSWPKAIKAAGLSKVYASENTNFFDKYPNQAAIVRAIQKRHRNGQSNSCVVVQNDDIKLKTSAYKHFGSWTKAKLKAKCP
jgi:hypothetical protein